MSKPTIEDKENALAAFESYPIRRLYDEASETWFFSVIDVVAALTDSANPRDYWKQHGRSEKWIQQRVMGQETLAPRPEVRP